MKKYIFFILASLFLLAGCQNIGHKNPSSPAEAKQFLSEAQTNLNTCAKRAADKLDDGISDVQSIALTIALKCKNEYDRLNESYSDVNLKDESQKTFYLLTRNTTKEKISTFSSYVTNRRPPVPGNPPARKIVVF